MIIVVCPGQGSQAPGFLTPWLAEPRFRDQLQLMSDVAELDLIAHGTTSDADTIRDTAVAQPLIVAAGLITLSAVLEGGRSEKLGGIAGHSVGEVTAAAGAGILTPDDAMRFVRERGSAMAEAAAITQTGMSAVIGANQQDLLARLGELDLEPANFNGGGQVVVAGALAALAALKENPPSGARVIPLQVAGAFHTRYMRPAVARLETATSNITVSDPGVTIWTNRDGSAVASGQEFLKLMIGQVSSPVRWDLCMETFAAAQVTGIIELAPSGALVGLAKRGLKGIPALAIKTPDDLEAAHLMIDQDAPRLLDAPPLPSTPPL